MKPHETRFAFEHVGSIFRFCDNIDNGFDKFLDVRSVAQVVLDRPVFRTNMRGQRAPSQRCQGGLADGLRRGLLIRHDEASKFEIASRKVDINRCSAAEGKLPDLALGNCCDDLGVIHAADGGELGAGLLE